MSVLLSIYMLEKYQEDVGHGRGEGYQVVAIGQVNHLNASSCQRSDVARPTGVTSGDELLDANPSPVKEVLAVAPPDIPPPCGYGPLPSLTVQRALRGELSATPPYPSDSFAHLEGLC